MAPKKRKIDAVGATLPAKSSSSSPRKRARLNAKTPAIETAAASRPKRGSGSPAAASATATSRASAGRARGKTDKAAKIPSKLGDRSTTAKSGVSSKGKRKSASVEDPEVATKKAGRSSKKESTKSGAARRGSEVSVQIDPNGVAAQSGDQVGIEEEEDDDDDDAQYWLMKAEPESRVVKGVDVKFSIDDLAAADKPECWDGVRNPVARNNMRLMRRGDKAFLYHSNCKTPGIAGIMEIAQEHSVDETAFDPNHPYYDEKSSRDKPKWELVHVRFVRKFDELIKLSELKSFAEKGGALEDLQMLRLSRLSVSKVTPKQWRFIMSLVDDGQQDEDGEVPGDALKGDTRVDSQADATGKEGDGGANDDPAANGGDGGQDGRNVAANETEGS